MRIPATAVMAAAFLSAVFLSAAISTSAQAADPEKGGGSRPPIIYGAGTKSCGSWLADRDTAMHPFDLSWVLGWLSGTEGLTAGLGAHLRETDANAVSAWVDKYCREHPLNKIADASMALMIELAKPE